MLLIPIVVLPAILRPGNFFADDSFFYQQVAHNISRGYGITFSRITPTNGFHPLWLANSAVVHTLSQSNKIVALKWIVVNQGVLFLVQIALLWKICNQFKWQLSYLGVVILMFFFLTGMYGSEAHLNGVFLLLVVYTGIVASYRLKVSSWVVFGLALGFSVLARLDNIFIVMTIYVSVIYYQMAIQKVKTMSIFLLPIWIVIGVLTPYLVYNQVVFGHIAPISGALKSTFPNAVFSIDCLSTLGWVSILTAIMTIILLIVRKNDVPDQIRFILMGLAVGMIMQSTYLVVFTKWGKTWSWYYVPMMVNIAVVSQIVKNILLGEHKLRKSTFAVIALILMVTIGRSWGRYFNATNSNAFISGELSTRVRWQESLAFWMKENIPAGSNICVCDAGGMIAYWSDLNTLPLDGLINDYEYQESIVEIGIEQYLINKKVEYVVCRLGESLVVGSALYGESAGEIDLEKAELILRADTLDIYGIPEWGVYKI